VTVLPSGNTLSTTREACANQLGAPDSETLTPCYTLPGAQLPALELWYPVY